MTEREQLGPPPVEPMSDVAWARIERGLWQRMDSAEPAPARRSRRWLWIAAPACLAAAAAAALVLVGGEDDATSPVIAARGNDPIRLVSGASSSAATIGDAHVTLDADSAVTMSRDTSPDAVVERGAAWFAISPRTGRAFVVAAGDTTIRVIGTRFRVARYEEVATVEVERGLVELTYRGTTLQVGAGHVWTSTNPSQITERTAEVSPAPARPLPEPPKVERSKPAVHQAPASKLETKAPDATAQAKFDRLQALEVSDPSAAITGYLELARGEGAYAELALFSAGRLASDRGEARAATLLTVYLTRFPQGRNVDDANRLLERIKR